MFIDTLQRISIDCTLTLTQIVAADITTNCASPAAAK